MARLDEALGKTPLRKQSGSDQITGHFLRRLPPEARRKLSAPLAGLNAVGLLSLQQTLVTVALIYKAGGRGDRPITKLSHLYRRSCKCSADQVQRWDAVASGPWDRARAGFSALGAAWETEFLAEVSKHNHHDSAVALLDLTKFYDYVCWSKLLDHAASLQYPVWH